MRYFPKDYLPYKRRLNWKQRERWLYKWQQLTRKHPRYRFIFWSAFVISFALALPPGLRVARQEKDPVVGSWVMTGLCFFWGFWMAGVVPYLFTRPELKRQIRDWI